MGNPAFGERFRILHHLIWTDVAVGQATIMGWLTLLARILGRRTHGFAALSAATFLMTAINRWGGVMGRDGERYTIIFSFFHEDQHELMFLIASIGSGLIYKQNIHFHQLFNRLSSFVQVQGDHNFLKRCLIIIRSSGLAIQGHSTIEGCIEEPADIRFTSIGFYVEDEKFVSTVNQFLY